MPWNIFVHESYALRGLDPALMLPQEAKGQPEESETWSDEILLKRC